MFQSCDNALSPMSSERFRFGLYEFDAATRELRREGVLVRLQAQPAQVLASLIEYAGQVVSRDQLRKTLWGGDTFVDFDRGLNFCISQLRSALKDDSTEPTYIRTIPKQGYQFIAPVERTSGPALNGETHLATQSRGNKRSLVLAWTAGIVVALALTAGYQLWLRHSSTPTPIVAVVRFDNETGNPDLDRFSDGLCDSVVERLTALSSGQYQVAGNALILRTPRDQRDLSAIAASLHAAYVVLGQVQADGSQVRILAHLIHLPEQTHVWVVRTDRELADQLGVQSDVAQQIAAEFSPRVAQQITRRSALPASGSH